MSAQRSCQSFASWSTSSPACSLASWPCDSWTRACIGRVPGGRLRIGCRSCGSSMARPGLDPPELCSNVSIQGSDLDDDPFFGACWPCVSGCFRGSWKRSAAAPPASTATLRRRRLSRLLPPRRPRGRPLGTELCQPPPETTNSARLLFLRLCFCPASSVLPCASAGPPILPVLRHSRAEAPISPARIAGKGPAEAHVVRHGHTPRSRHFRPLAPYHSLFSSESQPLRSSESGRLRDASRVGWSTSLRSVGSVLVTHACFFSHSRPPIPRPRRFFVFGGGRRRGP